MQICYRCEEKTNEFLEKTAKKKGVSKNRLIDEIVNNYLKYGYYHTDNFHPGHKEKEILTGIQLANELLAQIVDELNSLQVYMDTEIPAANSNESSPIFRLHTIQLLLEVSKNLEAIQKNIFCLTNKNTPPKILNLKIFKQTIPYRTKSGSVPQGHELRGTWKV